MKTLCIWCTWERRVQTPDWKLLPHEVGAECKHDPKTRPELTVTDDGRPFEWRITLNRYQRDNLMWLLAACGYPSSPQTVAPFHLANNGDWNGEIPNMLIVPGRENPYFQPATDDYRKGHFDPVGDRTNCTIERLKDMVDSWRGPK